jgi:hypothetical protein
MLQENIDMIGAQTAKRDWRQRLMSAISTVTLSYEPPSRPDASNTRPARWLMQKLGRMITGIKEGKHISQ